MMSWSRLLGTPSSLGFLAQSLFSASSSSAPSSSPSSSSRSCDPWPGRALSASKWLPLSLWRTERIVCNDVMQAWVFDWYANPWLQKENHLALKPSYVCLEKINHLKKQNHMPTLSKWEEMLKERGRVCWRKRLFVISYEGPWLAETSRPSAGHLDSRPLHFLSLIFSSLSHSDSSHLLFP